MWNKSEMKGHIQLFQKDQIDEMQLKYRELLKARNFPAAMEQVQLIVDSQE